VIKIEECSLILLLMNCINLGLIVSYLVVHLIFNQYVMDSIE